MLLLLHITIAISSIAFASFILVRPGKSKIRGSYALIAGTLISGTALVVSTGTHILQACVTGLAYLAVVLTLTAFASRKLKPESQ